MAKTKKHVLDFENEQPFEIIGLCSHLSDYRIAWDINNTLKWNLSRATEDFVVQNKKGTVLSKHSFYFWNDKENLVEYYLIKNKCDGKFLISEKAQIDHFLIINNLQLEEVDDVLEKVKLVNSIMASYIFDANSLPSTENIVI